MKRYFLATLLILLSLSSFGQETAFIGLTGTILRNATSATYTNSASGDQALFSSTIPANSMTTNRPYVFACDMSITIPTLSIPTITSNVKLGTNTLNFVSSAGLATGVTNGTISITGYLIKQPNGNVLVKFSVSPTGSISTINLTTSNTNQIATWIVDTTVAQALSINVAFGGFFLGTTTLTRQYYVRSDF